MRHSTLCIISLLFSLTVCAQKAIPVRWETKAVQTGEDIFEIHMTCTIDDGWYLCEPNRLDICSKSPIISFEESSTWERLTDIDILSYKKKDTVRRGSFNGKERACLIPYYEGNVTFIMVVRRNMYRCQPSIVRGKINYQPVSRISQDTPMEISFALPLEERRYIFKKVSKTRVTRFKTKRTVRFCPGFPSKPL